MSRPRKAAIRNWVRREIARRYGCPPGQKAFPVRCAFCETMGEIWWWTLSSGKPSAWVSFSLEIDHVIPESRGGSSLPENLVLSCQRCNRSRCNRSIPE